MGESLDSKAEVADSRWGRRPGAGPPLPVWSPAVFSAVLGLLLTLVVVLVIRPPGPLDQASLGDQRDGLLDDGPVVETSVGGVRFGDRPVVLLFVRDQTPDADVLSRWSTDVSSPAQVVVAVQADEPEVTTTARVQVVADPGEVLAAAVDLPVPQDGGPGVGYAVVDSARVVRYSTLDPSWSQNAFEVATIVGSVP